jgi:hypothetical protein
MTTNAIARSASPATAAAIASALVGTMLGAVDPEDVTWLTS